MWCSAASWYWLCCQSCARSSADAARRPRSVASSRSAWPNGTGWSSPMSTTPRVRPEMFIATTMPDTGRSRSRSATTSSSLAFGCSAGTSTSWSAPKAAPSPVSADFHDHVAAADAAIDEVLERRLQRAVGVRDRGLAQRAVRLARVHDREAADARGREACGCVQHRFGIVDRRRAARRSRAACAAAPGCVVRLRAATRARAPARTLPRPRRCTGDRRR